MTKATVIRVRMTEKEKLDLLETAKKNGLTLSDYIRIRILEQTHKPINEYQRAMSTYGLVAYYTLGQIAKKQLSEEEITDARAKANSALAKWAMNEE